MEKEGAILFKLCFSRKGDQLTDKRCFLGQEIFTHCRHAVAHICFISVHSKSFHVSHQPQNNPEREREQLEWAPFYRFHLTPLYWAPGVGKWGLGRLEILLVVQGGNGRTKTQPLRLMILRVLAKLWSPGF